MKTPQELTHQLVDISMRPDSRLLVRILHGEVHVFYANFPDPVGLIDETIRLNEPDAAERLSGVLDTLEGL